jgi:Fascin domain
LDLNYEDIGIAIYYSKQFEGLLESKFGAIGRGLHEKLTSVQQALSEDIVRSLRWIATVRNKIVHDPNYNVIDDKERFVSRCKSVLERLETALPNPKTNIVAIKGANGKFVCADQNMGGLVFSNREQASDWETFCFVSAHGRVAIQTYDGKFISADNNIGGNLVANRCEAREWEQFSLIRDKDKFSLRAHNKRFVSADLNHGGQLVADRDNIDEWEKFELINLSTEPLE